MASALNVSDARAIGAPSVLEGALSRVVPGVGASRTVKMPGKNTVAWTLRRRRARDLHTVDRYLIWLTGANTFNVLTSSFVGFNKG
ncbi:hypothetical protein M514_15710 [Trichuris suis]|uniref:Uncharacterized protein n=1 Tax=Trichuris suis TaxID=68888 RepID=A0A085NRB2_9BILA|nr:hypothetical protein M514_15710 [Trichuris suis]